MKNYIHILAAGILTSACASSMAGLITEDFSGGTFDSANFEIGAGTGSTGSEAWVSQNRGTLRTVANDLVGTASSILNVEADLTFFGGGEIAFLGVRSTGLPTAPYSEPGDSVFLRVHNFQNGHTGISGSSSFNPYAIANFGDSFYSAGQTIHVSLTDNGSLVNAIFTNTVTNATNSLSLATSLSYDGHVVFSAGGTSSWDNIEISHASIAMPAPGSLALLLLGGAALVASRRLQPARTLGR